MNYLASYCCLLAMAMVTKQTIPNNIVEDEIINDNREMKKKDLKKSGDPHKERLERLKVMAQKYDSDENGIITYKELNDWIEESHTHYINEDADKYFATHDTNHDGKINWTEYRQNTYGHLSDEQLLAQSNGFSYTNMLKRDLRRWSQADQDNNSFCTKEEFRAFIHPEEFDHTRDLFAVETLEDLDRNKDGYVDVNEYLGEVVKPDEPEPDWIPMARKDFKEQKDLDGDGKMNKSEISAWIMPSTYNQSKAEAKHLIYTADDDKDGDLTIAEIVAHHDAFAMSMATQWGDSLKPTKDN